MYRFYDENGKLVMEAQRPIFEDYDPVCGSFFVVEEEAARAVIVYDTSEEPAFEPYHANLEGRNPFPWLKKTVRMEKD